MKIEEIKELAAMLENSSLNFIEIKEGEFQILMGKSEYVRPGVFFSREAAAAFAAALVLTVSRTGVGTPKEAQGVKNPLASDLNTQNNAQDLEVGTPVKSPMVGVFYEAAAPGEPAFVTVGQSVQRGDVLCIIEAMKLMNEITAERDGVITKVCAENGQIVEYGQPLFYIQ